MPLSTPARIPAFAPAGAAVGATLLTCGAGALEFALAVAVIAVVIAIYRTYPGAMRVAAGVFLIVALRALWLAPGDLGVATSERWSGVVEDVAHGAASQRATVSLDSPEGLRVALSITDIQPRLSVGDSVSFSAHLIPAMRYASIPGMGMSTASLRASRVSATAVADAREVRLAGRSDATGYVLSTWRTRLAEAIYASPLSPEASRMLVAACLGSSDAPAGLKAAFRSAGISHLLCVSGFHVAVVAAVAAFLLFPFRYLRRGRWRGAVIIVIVWLYALVVGAGAPVLRAAVMITALYLASILQRRSNPPNSLCVALTAILAIDPYSLFSAGLQLSFAAVAGLLCFGEVLNPVPRRFGVPHRLAAVFVVPAVVMMSTLPVMLAWFGYISFFTIPANALACLVFPVFMVCGAVASALWYAGVAAQPLISLCDTLAAFMESTLAQTESLATESSVSIAAGTFTITNICVALAALGCVFHLHSRRFRGLAASVCVTALLCTGCEAPAEGVRVVADGDRYGTSLYIAGRGRAEVWKLDGGSTARFNPAFNRFMESGRADTVLRIPTSELPHIMAVHGRRFVFPDGDSRPADFPEADFFFVGKSFRESFAPYADSCSIGCVLISTLARPEVAAEVRRECRDRGIVCHELANRPLYMEF